MGSASLYDSIFVESSNPILFPDLIAEKYIELI
jgi:hypothetical protein